MFRIPDQTELARFFSSPVFTHNLHELLNHPQRNSVLYSELAFLVVFLVFRSWRKSKGFALGWIGSLLFQLWTALLFIIVTYFVIPYFIFGKPYVDLTREFFGFLIRSCWKS